MIMVEIELPCRDQGKSHTLHILILTVKFIIFFSMDMYKNFFGILIDLTFMWFHMSKIPKRNVQRYLHNICMSLSYLNFLEIS